MPASDPEHNKELIRRQRAESQRRALPSGLPGEENFELQTPLSGFTPAATIHAVDPPGHDANEMLQQAAGFPSQAISPTFLSYGPMIAEGAVVAEEFESFIYGADGTLYNNQYCQVWRIEDDQVVEYKQYNDSHHAWQIFGRFGGWAELMPPTGPRRRHRIMGGSKDLPASELETVFEVVDEFDLDPQLIADVVPSPSEASSGASAGGDANRDLVRRLRQAMASGDRVALTGCFAPGYRHFIAGERPFGWDHLPLDEIYAPLVEHLASPLKIRYGPPIVDGDTVFEEMDCFGQLDDGTVYNNWHCFIHEIRNGRIVQTREYLDTRHVWVVLGRWASWGPEPDPPRRMPRRSNLQAIRATTQTPTMFLDLDRWRPFDPPRADL